MQENLRHKGQAVIRVISEMLCETRKVAENCSVGTSSDNARLNRIYEENARKGIQKSLLLRREYCAEVLKESHELAINTGTQERVLRMMFRSVWETACSIKSLVETFVADPSQISLYNALVMQRDLVHKIIDIPFIHRSGKGHQYLDYYIYVSGPQRMVHNLRNILPNLIESGEDVSDCIVTMFEVRLGAILHRYEIQRNVGLNGEAELGEAFAVCEVLVRFHDNLAQLDEIIRDALEHDRAEDVPATVKDKVHALIQETLHEAMHQLIATFVEKYYPQWGDWTKLSPEVQKKRLEYQLNSWTNTRRTKKKDEGLLLYLKDDGDFYNLEAIGLTASYMEKACNYLPQRYHMHSLFAHGSIWNSTHEKQKWEESPNDLEILDVVRDICTTAIYVAAAHYYDCADISDKMEPLQRIIRAERLTL